MLLHLGIPLIAMHSLIGFQKKMPSFDWVVTSDILWFFGSPPGTMAIARKSTLLTAGICKKARYKKTLNLTFCVAFLPAKPWCWCIKFCYCRSIDIWSKFLLPWVTKFCCRELPESKVEKDSLTFCVAFQAAKLWWCCLNAYMAMLNRRSVDIWSKFLLPGVTNFCCRDLQEGKLQKNS